MQNDFFKEGEMQSMLTFRNFVKMQNNTDVQMTSKECVYIYIYLNPRYFKNKNSKQKKKQLQHNNISNKIFKIIKHLIAIQ